LKDSVGKNISSYLKRKLKVKKTSGMVQMVEYLPSKCKVLSSNPNTTKINKETNK
jgi:hypothetical protein